MDTSIQTLLSIDNLKTKNGDINTKRINNIFKENDLSFLEGETPLEKTYLYHHSRTFCENCGKPTSFISWAQGYQRFCSKECERGYRSEKMKDIRAQQPESTKLAAKEKYKSTCLKKYGATCALHNPEIQQKVKQTNLERYGVENASSNKEIREKVKQTNLRRYGDEVVSRNPKVKEKTKATCIKKYGVDNVFKSEVIKTKIRQTCLNKYGVEYSCQAPLSKEHTKQTFLKKYGDHPSRTTSNKEKVSKTWANKIEKIEKEKNCTLLKHLTELYGTGWCQSENFKVETLAIGTLVFVENKYIPLIKKYWEDSLGNRSHAEIEVFNFCKSILPEEEVLSNTKQIITTSKGNPAELDIYIPAKRVAIEYDGCIWHAEDKEKQLYKTIACDRLGIRLLHIWDDLWLSKKSIYKSIISSALGVYERKVYARKCKCRVLSPEEYTSFLEKNHIQGSVNSSLRLGLFYGDELVQVAGWGKSRFKDGEYELHRMCSKLNTQVIGGFSKLIKHSNLDGFISYIDRSLYNGSGYVSCGFEKIGETPPGYFYWSSSKGRLSRYQTQKHKLCKTLATYDDKLSELENLHNNHYLRVYDCGNIKVKYDKR